MKYPEGDEVRVGDIIWTNGGCHVRRVVQVLSAEEALKWGIEDDSGLMWARNINPHSPIDMRGFESESDFSYEGIGKLSPEELQYVEYLVHVLEAQLKEKIWHHPYALYYPVFYRLNDKFSWYIFYSVSHAGKERCYEFREHEGKFYLIDDEAVCRRVRVL